MARHKIRQTEIDDFDVPTIVKQQVFDFEVTMDKTVCV